MRRTRSASFVKVESTCDPVSVRQRLPEEPTAVRPPRRQYAPRGYLHNAAAEENGAQRTILLELSQPRKITMSSVEPRGQFVWHELMTTDTAAAGDFYPRVAGWKSQPWEQDSAYTLWVGRGGPMGGLMRM